MNLTSESFSILWNGTKGEFDGFVLEIIDSDWLMEPKEYNISHDVKSYDVTGLRPSTDYIAYLYGTYKGSRTSAVSIVASTGNRFYVYQIISLQENCCYLHSKVDLGFKVTNTCVILFLINAYILYFLSPVAEEPDLSKLVVSNITSDRFSLSWRTREKAFDKFIVEVRESALPSQAMGRALPGDVRSTVMTGLKASTGYNIKLYATGVDGQNTQPLFAVASTGITWLTFLDTGHAAYIVMYMYAGRHNWKAVFFFYSEDIPQLGPIAASSASPHNLSLSWSTVSGHFDGFVIRVTDSEQQSETLEFRLPGDVHNITVTNLMDATGYDIELYGISHGRHTPTVLAHAVTGTTYFTHIFYSNTSSILFSTKTKKEFSSFYQFNLAE